MARAIYYTGITLAVVIMFFILINLPPHLYEAVQKPLTILGGLVIVISVVLGYLSFASDAEERALNFKIEYTTLDDRYIIQMEKMAVKFPAFERPMQLINGEDLDLITEPLTPDEKNAAYHLCGMYYQIIEDIIYIGLVSKNIEKSDRAWSNVFFTWIKTDMFKAYHKTNNVYFLQSTDDYIRWVIDNDIQIIGDTGDGEIPPDYYTYFRDKAA